MLTPTSPEPRANEQIALADALAAIGQGRTRAKDVARLSDLSKQETTRLAEVWPSLPERTRAALVRQMGDLAEDRVELNFGRALRLGLDDPSSVVRQLAIAALWEDRGSDLLPRFLDLLRTDPSQDVRAEAAGALGRFADLVVSGDAAEVVGAELRQALEPVAAKRRNPDLVRRRALESVAVFGSDPAIVRLIDEFFASDDPGLRSGALSAVGRTMDPRWLNRVLEEFDSDDPEVRYEAVRASGAIGDDRAVPELAQLAQELDVEIRQAAITALGQIGGQAAVRTLRSIAAQTDEGDRDVVEAALDEATGGFAPLRTMG